MPSSESHLSGGVKSSAADRDLPPRNAGQSAKADEDTRVVILTTARTAITKVNRGIEKVPGVYWLMDSEQGCSSGKNTFPGVGNAMTTGKSEHWLCGLTELV